MTDKKINLDTSEIDDIVGKVRTKKSSVYIEGEPYVKTASPYNDLIKKESLDELVYVKGDFPRDMPTLDNQKLRLRCLRLAITHHGEHAGLDKTMLAAKRFWRFVQSGE